jgi:hypothetical protein
MFCVVVGFLYKHTDIQGESMTREQAIQEAAEVLVHWLTVEEAVAA